MQMVEHKKLVDQRKRGAPGSKEAEVFHLQEAMEERNERNVRPTRVFYFVRLAAESVAVNRIATKAVHEEQRKSFVRNNFFCFLVYSVRSFEGWDSVVCMTM